MTVTLDIAVIGTVCGILMSVWGVIALIARPIRTIRKQYNAVSQGMVVILHFRLNRECLRIQKKGYMTLGERQDLEDIYNAYAALGGNGTGHQMYMETIKLPVRENDAVITTKEEK